MAAIAFDAVAGGDQRTTIGSENPQGQRESAGAGPNRQVALSIQRDMSWKTLKGQEPQERRPIGLSRRSRGEQYNRAGDAEPIRGAHQSPYGSGAEAHAKRRRQRRRTIKTTVRGENT